MALKPALSLKQSQRISLTPQLRQSLSFLRLPLVDALEQTLAQAHENPVIVVTDPRQMPTGDSPYEIALNTVAASVSLGNSIRQQLASQRLDPIVLQAALYLTGDLSDAGFLETDLAETARVLNVPDDCINTAIAAIQTCEPTGVGARNILECLHLQLVEHGIDAKTASDILTNIDSLLKQDWANLERILQLPKVTLEKLAALIRSLNPRPVPNDNTPLPPLAIDLTVTVTDKRQILVALTEGIMPDLAINTTLLEQLKADAATAKYILQQHKLATTLIRTLQYRNETILKIARIIVAHQHRYFLDGQKHLSPLNRKDIAKRLSLHPSTIGRAISDKFLLFNNAVFPLHFFLTGKLDTGPAKQISVYSLQQKILVLIADETAGNTLTDNAIVEIFHLNGVDIARRTVAKYRGCMNIPSSYTRQRLLAAQRTRPPKSGDVG